MHRRKSSNSDAKIALAPNGSLRGYLSRHATLHHLSTLVTGSIVTQVLSMLGTVVLTRLYTPTDFGLLAAFMSIAALIAAVATLRYDMAIMLPHSHPAAAVVRSAALRIAIFVCAIATAFLVILAHPIAEALRIPALTPWLLLAGPMAFFLAHAGISTYWLNRKLRYRQISIWRVAQTTATVLGQLCLSFARTLGSTGLIAGALFGQLIATFGSARSARIAGAGARTRRQDRRSAIRRYRRMALWSAPTALTDTVRINGINLLIGTAAVVALGQFSLAWKIVQVPAAMIGSALAQVFYQKLSTTAPGKMTTAIWRSIRLTACIGAVAFPIIWLLAPTAVPLIFGSEWSMSAEYVRALLPWIFLTLITSPISTVFIIADLQHWALVTAVFYAATPLTILALMLSHDTLMAVRYMSFAMAAILVINIMLAHFAARRFDRGISAPQVQVIVSAQP